MTMKTLPLVLLGLLFGSSCSDRPTDEPTDDSRVRLCTQHCEQGVRCSQANGGDYTREECMDTCLTMFFGENVRECAQVASEQLECYISRGDSCDGNDACVDAAYPFSVCRGDPEYWAAHDCDDKCPGECCQNMDSGRQ